ADALRGEYLHQVSAVFDDLPDELTDLIRWACVFVDGSDRCQQTRSRQHASRDGRAQGHVKARADALGGGETVDEHGIRVLRLVQDGLFRGLAFTGCAAVLSEMSGVVNVVLYDARQHG